YAWPGSIVERQYLRVPTALHSLGRPTGPMPGQSGRGPPRRVQKCVGPVEPPPGLRPQDAHTAPRATFDGLGQSQIQAGHQPGLARTGRTEQHQQQLPALSGTVLQMFTAVRTEPGQGGRTEQQQRRHGPITQTQPPYQTTSARSDRVVSTTAQTPVGGVGQVSETVRTHHAYPTHPQKRGVQATQEPDTGPRSEERRVGTG